MKAPLILLHEEALRLTHPVFYAAPTGTKAIYVWDHAYFRKANYSLKRLVFIYETLCELPIELIQGSTAQIVQDLAPSTLFMPATNNPLISEIITNLKNTVSVQIIEDEPFVIIKNFTDAKRFFQYWNKAGKSAFLKNGGRHA